MLRQHLAGRRFGFDVERLIYLTVLHRMMVSGLGRHASRQQTLDIIDGDSSDQARHCTDAIEEALYQHRKSLFGAISVAFFDTTPLYFEGGGGAATLGQRGHTKDFRPQLQSGRVGYRAGWAGPADRLLAVARQHRRCDRPAAGRRTAAQPLRGWGACIVADRRMISAATIAALDARKIDYVGGARECSSKEVRETVLPDDGAAVPLTILRQRGH